MIAQTQAKQPSKKVKETAEVEEEALEPQPAADDDAEEAADDDAMEEAKEDAAVEETKEEPAAAEKPEKVEDTAPLPDYAKKEVRRGPCAPAAGRRARCARGAHT